MALSHLVSAAPRVNFTWYDAALGLIALPGVMVVTGLAARRLAGRAIHFTGLPGLAVNTAAIAALITNHYTAPAPTSSTGSHCWWPPGAASPTARQPSCPT